MDNIIIRDLDPAEQSEARALIHHNCPVDRQLMHYSDDADKIYRFQLMFISRGYYSPVFHTVVLGAYTSDGQLIGALNMNSQLYILENPQSPEELYTVMAMIWNGARSGIYIDNIGVDPDFRRQGVGTALIERALHIAKNRFALRYVGLAATTPESTEFFQNMGFTVCDDGLPASFFGDTIGLKLPSLLTTLGMNYMLKEL